MHKYNRTVLENGLRIITSPLKNTQAMTILVLVGAGSRYENKENNGISHFLEHMFFKGAKKYKNTKEVSEAIDGVGGIFNAFTGKEYAGYYVKVAAEEQDTAYDVLSDMMIHSTFHPFEIDKERGVILEEYNMYQDTPMYQIGWDFEKIIFGDQPIGRDQIGTKKLIEAVTQEDFLNYKESLYTTDNTVISIAGNVEHEEAVEKIKKFFQFPEKKKSLSWEKFKNYQTKENTILRNKKTEQGHIVVGVPGYHTTHPDYFAAKVLSVILGGNMSSRMFLSVREAQGLCYYIHTTTDDYNDCGVLSTRAGVDLKRVDQAITAIVKEYQKIREKKITEKELQKGKAYVKGKLIISLEDSEEVAHLLGKQDLLEEGIKTWDEIKERVDKVTAEDIYRISQDLFQEDKLYLATIGPFKDKEHFQNLLHFT